MKAILWRFISAWKAFKNPAIMVDAISIRRLIERPDELAIIKGDYSFNPPFPVIKMLPYRDQASIRRYLGI